MERSYRIPASAPTRPAPSRDADCRRPRQAGSARKPVTPVVAAVLSFILLMTTVMLLASRSLHLDNRPERRPAALQLPANGPAGSLIGRWDTIDGNPFADPELLDRMQRVAASIPAAVLADQSQGPGIRYVAQAFTPGDDPGFSEGWFENPAAALSFGCALDDPAGLACGQMTEALLRMDNDQGTTEVALSAHESMAGWRCRPLGIAIGSPTFEPVRCESGQ